MADYFASVALSAEFVVKQWAEDLPGEFVVKQWAEDLLGEFVVKQWQENLLGELIVRHSGPIIWLGGWLYRKIHTLTGSTAGAQTNYQMGVKVYYGAGVDGIETVDGVTFGKIYCNSKCKMDFSDIRFTNWDSITLLDYWLQEKSDSDYALFWVEVDSIPANPDTVDIYIYYGNSGATTTSDGDDTFTFFDDFTRDRGWTIGNGTYIQIIDPEDCLWIDYRRPASNLYCYRPVSGLADGFELWIDSWYDITVGADDWVAGYFNLSVNNDGSRHSESEIYGIRGWGQAYGNKHGLLYWNGTGLVGKQDGDADPNSDRFIYRIRKHDTRLEYYCSSDNVADGTEAVAAGIPAIAYMKAWITNSQEGDVNDDCRKKIHLIRIRKWIYPEPTHTTWGPEAKAGALGGTLFAEFVVKQWQEDLPAEFVVGQGLANLKAGFDSQAILDLPAEFVVGQGIENLPGEFIIRHSVPDPTKLYVYGPNALATTSPYDDCVIYPFQRNVWYANGRHWVFYVHNYNFKYVSSTDGVAWDGPTNIRAVNTTERGRRIATWMHNDGYLHYVYSAESSGFEPRYRKGKLESDGSITWADEQVFSSIPSGSYCYWPSICVDANGYPWVGFYYFDPSPETRLAYIITSTTKDGTWTTNPNYGTRGLAINSTSLLSWIVIPVPLANGKIVAYYGGGDSTCTKFWARLCDGDGIGDEAELSSGGDWDNFYTGAAIALENVVIAAFGSTDLTLRVCRWEGEAWGSESTVQTGVEANTCPAFFKDEQNDIVYLVWGNTTDDELRYKLSRDKGVTWIPAGNTEYNVLISIPNGLDAQTRWSISPEKRNSLVGFAWTNTSNNLEYGWIEFEDPTLKAVFEVGQDSIDLPARFEVGQDSAELLSKFEAQATTELLSNAVIRHPGSAELLGKFEVGQDSAEFLGKAVIRNLGSAELLGKFEAQATADLLGKADITHSVELLGRFEVGQDSAELPARFLIPRAYDFSGGMGISFDWWGSGGVDQQIDFEMWSLTGGWVGRFPDGAAKWRQVQLSWDDLTEVDLDGTRPDSSQIIGIYWTYHTPGVRRIDGIRAWMRQNLLCKVNITHSIDLLGKFEAQATADLLGKAVIRHSDTAELLGKFEVPQGFNNLLGKFEVMVDP